MKSSFIKRKAQKENQIYQLWKFEYKCLSGLVGSSFIDDYQVYLTEGDSVIIVCKTDANPSTDEVELEKDVLTRVGKPRAI